VLAGSLFPAYNVGRWLLRILALPAEHNALRPEFSLLNELGCRGAVRHAEVVERIKRLKEQAAEGK